MRNALVRAACFFVFSWIALARGADSAPDHNGGQFVIFNALLHSGMPNLEVRGLHKMTGSGNLWRQGVSNRDVDEVGVRQAVRYLRTISDTYYFDIEHWILLGSDDTQLKADVDKFLRVAEIARSAVPDGRFGFYDVAPKRTYWAILLQKDHPELLAAWRHMNDLSAPIAAKSDFLFPSLYTFYDDPQGWEVAAIEVIKTARRLGKPVYPFLMFEFHNSNKELAGKQIPRASWRRELDVVRKYADGVVLWGGFGEHWDEKAGWWLETLEFMRSLDDQSHSPPTPRPQQ